MIKHSYSKIVSGVSGQKLWNTWSDVNHWKDWQDDLETSSIVGEFQEGNYFSIRPKGGPNVKIKLIKVRDQKQFVDMTQFPLAKMYGDHEFIQIDQNTIEIKTTMSIEGPLAFLWKFLVMNGIVKGMEKQTEALVSYTIKSK